LSCGKDASKSSDRRGRTFQPKYRRAMGTKGPVRIYEGPIRSAKPKWQAPRLPNRKIRRKHRNERSLELLLSYFGLAMAILVPIGVLAAVAFGTCPRCSKVFSMRRTGQKRKPPGRFTRTEEEWVCKRCGYREWRKEPINCVPCCQ
jgi:hypothetical protein